jgi:hypothetical protein
MRNRSPRAHPVAPSATARPVRNRSPRSNVAYECAQPPLTSVHLLAPCAAATPPSPPPPLLDAQALFYGGVLFVLWPTPATVAAFRPPAGFGEAGGLWDDGDDEEDGLQSYGAGGKGLAAEGPAEHAAAMGYGVYGGGYAAAGTAAGAGGWGAGGGVMAGAGGVGAAYHALDGER